MSYDSIGDRNRNLSREGFNSADLINAIVTDNDSEEVARYKIAQIQNPVLGARPASDTSPCIPSGAGSGGSVDVDADGSIIVIKTILWAIGILLLIAIVGAARSAKDEYFEHMVETRRDEAAATRIDEFSSFSKLPAWPKRVQEIYKKQERKPLEKMMDEIPRDLGKLSSKKQQMLGAQIWFKISSKGAGANEYLIGVQDKPHRVASPMLRAASLSICFLEAECGTGVEVACLDAAKSFAGLVWHGIGSSQEDWVIAAALGKLPSSGPLAKSSSIESLRTKLVATRASLKK
jgi:hypothetical protein